MRRNHYQFFPSLPSTSPSSCSQPITSCSSMRKRITNLQSDSTEVQAIAILRLARIEMEENLNKSRNSVASPYLQFQLHPSRGLSLMKSLQNFLQNRKDRIRATMPYSHKNAYLSKKF